MLIPARSLPKQTDGKSRRNGASMEPDTLGRGGVPAVPTPIREGRTRLKKCYVSFSTILPSDAMRATNRIIAVMTMSELEKRDSRNENTTYPLLNQIHF